MEALIAYSQRQTALKYALAFGCMLMLTLCHSIAANELPTGSCEQAHGLQTTAVSVDRKIITDFALPDKAENRRIHFIGLEQLNVFDTTLPEENNAIFRFANSAHIQTKPEVIRSVLLFQEGDLYDPQKLLESERLLRQQRYLYDAQITAWLACEGDVHVNVVTRDLWTLLPDLGFSQSGGQKSTRLGFRETNLLGLGKRLSLTYTTDDERKGYTFIYEDPNVLNSRYTSRLEYADNDDGQMHRLAFELPFFATDTPYSYGFNVLRNQRTEPLYEQGKVVHEFATTTELKNIYFGLSSALSDAWTQRTLFGIQEDSESFAMTQQSTLPIAQARYNRFPYVEMQWFENRFVKVRNIDSIFRTEDLSLGWNIHARFGYSPESLSNDESRYIYLFNASKALYLNSHSLLRFSAQLHGSLLESSGQPQNQVSTLNVQYFFNTSTMQSWYLNAEYQAIKNMTADHQLTLGGESGLRGYPAQYQQGNKKQLLNIERRYYWEYDLWQLFKVGGAAFFDVGKMTGSSLFNSQQGWLSDVGVGLRLAPSRANSTLMLHLDLAWPLSRSDHIDSVQWQFNVKNRF
jgi:outer membrane protein assembly factor BamA